jgi:VanZ family protein
MILKFLRALFWFALIMTTYWALVPTPPMPVKVWDKWQHMIAFVVLVGLAGFAWPTLRWVWLVTALAAFGAAIEFLQAVPMFHRDADIRDWIADIVAIAVGVVAITPVRKWFARQTLPREQSPVEA